MQKFLTDIKAFWRSFITLLAISAVWYGLEFIEFGTLCRDRKCDNIVGLLFFIALWYANHKVNYWQNAYVQYILAKEKSKNNKYDSKKE